MSFWGRVDKLELQDFRPGIKSKAEFGTGLVMACMEIGPGMEDSGHEHEFAQCGIVTQGRIEMSIEDERRVLGPMETYFIPSGTFHGWKTFNEPVRILDVSSR